MRSWSNTDGASSFGGRRPTLARASIQTPPRKRVFLVPFPVTVNFAFGWNDATQMLNCVNYDFSSSEDNLADRGVQTNPDGTYIAQITMHTDHTFWDKVRQEGANLRFDPVAAFAPR